VHIIRDILVLGHVETVEKMSNQKYKPDSYVKMEVDAEDYYMIKDEG